MSRGVRSVSLTGTRYPAAASYASTSGWRAWEGYGEEKPARGGTSALDRAAREERALNDLLVRSRHHERVLALVENGVVSRDAAFGVSDRSPAFADASTRRREEKTAADAKKEPRDAARTTTFRAANVATAFSRLRSALRRIPLGGVANRRREVASRVVCHDARYAKMRRMLRDALPSFGPIELATTTKALADIHAFAAHGRRPALRAAQHDTPEKDDAELGRLLAQSVRRNARRCDARRTAQLVAGLRGLGRVARRVADDDGWRAVADAVEAASLGRCARPDASRSDARNLFASIAWNLHYGDSWRSANRLARNPEPLSRAREWLGDRVWRAVAEKIVFGEPRGGAAARADASPSDATRAVDAGGDAKNVFAARARDDARTEARRRDEDDVLGDDGGVVPKPLSRRGLAMAMDAFRSSSTLRAALEALDAETGGEARRELQAAADRVAAATFRAGWRSDPRASELRRRLLIGWGPTPARVAAGRAPTECLAIGGGCLALGLRAHEGFVEPAPPWTSARRGGERRRRRTAEAEDAFFVDEDEDEDGGGGVLEDDDRADDDHRSSGGDGFLDVERFRVAGGRLDLAAIPPAPPRPSP